MPELQTRSDARRCYQRVVGIVAHNTGGPQPALLAEHHVQVHVDHTRHSPGDVRDALQAAVEHDDLLRVDRDGTPHYAVVDERSLVDVVEAEVATADPDKTLIARCNTHLDTLR